MLDRKRSDFFSQIFAGNVFLCAVAAPTGKLSTQPVVTESLTCLHIIQRGANLFPLHLRTVASEHDLFDGTSTTTAAPHPNLTPEAKAYLQAIGLGAEMLFYHNVAVLHASAYGRENAGALRQGWPRIPLPKENASLYASAELGRQVEALLDTEASVTGVDNWEDSRRAEEYRGLSARGRQTREP